jgi:hypothetical protein
MPAPAPAPAPAAKAIPALESVRPLPTRAPRPVEGGPPPAPADFDPPGTWEKVVALLLQRKRMLGHFLEAARPLGWQGDVLVLEVDPAHRGLIEPRDNRAQIVAALAEVYGRALDYRCVDGTPGASPPPPPVAREVIAEKGVQNVQNVRVGQPPQSEVPPAETAPQASAPTRKHPAELSPEARNTMLWLEGEIVGPARPNPPSSRGPA